MKKTNKKQAAAWVLSLLPLVMIAAVYRRLPAEVPMHWDLDGAVDYGAKAQLWVIAATAPVLEAMFCFLPKIDPKNKNYDKFGDAYLGIQLVTLLFLAAMTGICITEALRPGRTAECRKCRNRRRQDGMVHRRAVCGEGFLFYISAVLSYFGRRRHVVCH